MIGRRLNNHRPARKQSETRRLFGWRNRSGVYRSDDKGTHTDVRDLIQMHTISCLAAIGTAAKDAIPEIEAVTNDPDSLPIVRELAEDAIERISNDASKP